MIVTPTPIGPLGTPMPDATDMSTWPVRMKELVRWLVEEVGPGVSAQSSAAYQNALEAALSASMAQAVANYSGVWSTLSGSLAAGRSVFHSGKFWASLQAIANVATVAPGTDSTRWWPLDVNATVVGYNATTVAAALAAIEGTLSTGVALKDSATGAVILPPGTTAQRPASPVAGMVRYNTDFLMFEGYANGRWSLLNRRMLPRYTVTPGSTTSFSWTGLPSAMTAFKLKLEDVSNTGGNNYLLRVGPAAGVQTTGYWTFAHLITSGGSSSVTSGVTNGCTLMPNSAASALTGTLSGDLTDAATNTWVVSGEMTTAGGSTRTHSRVTLGAGNPLSVVEFLRTSSDTLDTGSLQLSIEG